MFGAITPKNALSIALPSTGASGSRGAPATSSSWYQSACFPRWVSLSVPSHLTLHQLETAERHVSSRDPSPLPAKRLVLLGKKCD